MAKLLQLNLLIRQQGYTLIEILIVLFIISIVSSVALLSINQNENKRLAAFANELMQTIQLAEEQALLQPAVIGFSVKDQALQFQTYQSSEGKSLWLPLDDTVLSSHLIPADIQVNIEIANQQKTAEDKSAQPQIVISTNGDLIPFIIYVGKPGKSPRYKVTGEADGALSIEALV